MTDTPADAPAPNVWPTLRYSEGLPAVEFAVNAFGFERTLVVPGAAEGSVAHAQLAWPPGGGVMLGSADEGSLPGVPVDVGSVYAVTDDVDGVYERALAAGATGVLEPRDEDYGGRGCTVRDPWGVFWSFGSYRGEPR